MTTTPAPTDLDQVRARHEVALRWLREGYSYDDNFNQAALLIRDDVPALLDELAEARREIRTLTDSDDAQVVIAQGERDAAREELAKTRAELAKVRAETLRWAADRIDPGPTANWPTPCSDTWETAMAAHRGTAARLRLWSEANPATTAEPAACICATWREETPFGLQAVTGPDATCPVHGEKAEPADEPKADESWRDFTIHTDWGNEQDVYVACRLDDVCEEVKHNPDERYLTLGEAVDWATEHAASPFHAEPAATPAQVQP